MKARVIQVIDNLGFGGAESMAVNIANLLHQKGHFSAICGTRVGGVNEEKLEGDIPKLILDRRYFFDLKALTTFTKYCKKNQIQIVHAHSSSIFFVIQAKFLGLKAKLVWHDHSGVSQAINDHKNFRKVKGGWKHYVYNSVISILKPYISYVIAVNDLLKGWAINDMKMPPDRVMMIENFPLLQKAEKVNKIDLPGLVGKRIVQLANIRKEKAHQFSLAIASEVLNKNPDWSFLYVGKHFENEVYEDFKKQIENHPFKNQIHYLGGRTDVTDILSNSDIAILTSSSEGLPVVILEYGMTQLPVVTTDVGQCADVVGENGFIVSFGAVNHFAEKLEQLINNPELRKKMGQGLQNQITKYYSADAAYEKLNKVYQTSYN